MTFRHPRSSLSPRQKAEVIRRQEGICACGCGEPIGTDPRDIQFDHRLELWEGGTNDLDNMAALIRKHHLVKTKRKTAERAKVKRIESRGGRRKLSAGERELARILEGRLNG